MGRRRLVFALLVFLASGVTCQPVDLENGLESGASSPVDISTGVSSPVESRPRMWKRFINPWLTVGSFGDVGLPKMRTKRSSEGCEKLQLCKLHARSNRNFLAAFELYFVNKENAKLWDHRTRSAADCERRFGAGCYGGAAPAQHTYRFFDEDYQ